MIEIWGDTDKGRVRQNNEDNIYFSGSPTDRYLASSGQKGQLLLVADGIGGAEAGEAASKLTKDTISSVYYSTPGHDPRHLLKVAIEEANTKVFQFSRSLSASSHAGSTVTAAAVVNGSVYVANVGDSRTYIYRSGTGRLDQISKDHSLTQQKVDQGLLHPSQARQDPDGNIITRSIGAQASVQVDLFGPIALNPGDTLVLCSDGLTDMLEDHEVVQILSHAQVKPAVQRLIKTANHQGGHDNISVVVGRVPGGPPIPAETLMGIPRHLIKPVGLGLAGLIALLLLVGGFNLAVRGGASQDVSEVHTVSQLQIDPPSEPSGSALGSVVGTAPPSAMPLDPSVSTRIPSVISQPPPEESPVAMANATSTLSQNNPTPTRTPVPPLPKIQLEVPVDGFSIEAGQETTFQWSTNVVLPEGFFFEIQTKPGTGAAEWGGVEDARVTTSERVYVYKVQENRHSYSRSIRLDPPPGDKEWRVVIIQYTAAEETRVLKEPEATHKIRVSEPSKSEGGNQDPSGGNQDPSGGNQDPGGDPRD